MDDKRERINQKINKISEGYSAFSESTEDTKVIRQELQRKQIDVQEEETELGTWFIPVNKRE